MTSRTTTPITPPLLLLLLLLLLLCFRAPAASSAGNNITAASPLIDGQTLVSPSGGFALGFFIPRNSNNGSRYIGIWYNNIPNQTIVWVANRSAPLTGSNGMLSLSPNGTLLVSNGAVNSSVILWSSAGRAAANPVARLLDSGEFVVVDGDGGGYIWRSFDHPTDKLLPGMKLGWDAATGINRTLTAWASPTDPTPGKYALFIDPRGSPQLVVAGSGEWVWRGGPWNGVSFSGCPMELTAGAGLGLRFRYVWKEDELTYSFDLADESLTPTYVFVDSAGFAGRYVCLMISNRWDLYWEVPQDPCGYDEVCGAYAVCNADNVPICSCLDGFTPADPSSLALRDLSKGCRRNTDLDCTNGTDGFVVLSNAKLPDSSEAMVNMSKGLDECSDWCLRNCSCAAYASANVSAAGGEEAGCIIWTGEVKDLRVIGNGGQDLYIRLASADIGIPAVSIQIISFNKGVNEEIGELPMFDMHMMKTATSHFCIRNKLGEGGFGIVYKGKLGEGQEIAVKRLARTSTQGINEFKNEVNLIAKLQHRNLVRLLGCCIEGDERLIVYEYMPNKSLDAFLFDEGKRSLLDWQTRYRIILGIARGLLYLHEDSRLTIIHRDLKASNILLDSEMRPKISDFGMARIFGGEETVVNTTKVVGT
ncbi:G-type lectin S-receptor-like serine/threonine-protein kinase [Platanthera zijinensis]|uniref:non-specific serine/threonine protein kinase n=1 Tax=Platanthera zijinensis TaxID=2320716 RepID=A0AAP0AXM7_9ASPA